MRDLALKDFFATATGSEIFDRIVPDRLILTLREMLIEIGARRALEEVTSEKFPKQDLRARMPSPKKGEKSKKGEKGEKGGEKERQAVTHCNPQSHRDQNFRQ